MPKSDIDYSNTVVYRIFCKVENVLDSYVGYTTNFTQRKYYHKINSKTGTDKLATAIQNYGGWSNWNMEQVAQYCCCNAEDAQQRKLYHCNILKPTLNEDLAASFVETTEKANDGPHFCACGKGYKHRQGLWKHTRTCEITSKSKTSTEIDVNEKQMQDSSVVNEHQMKIIATIVAEVVKENMSELFRQNTEFMTKMTETYKQQHEALVATSQNIVNSNNMITNNTNNNTFNLNMFLNETCKNAMNINEFVDSIKLDLSDLESVGKLGFVEGISNIIVKNLKALDVTVRPIHCPDQKREIIYIKDDNKWEKECEDKVKLKKAIKRVAYKNEMLLPQYKLKYPDYNDSESKRSDHYSKLVIESFGGVGGYDADKEEKIMKKITREVGINKAKYCIADL